MKEVSLLHSRHCHVLEIRLSSTSSHVLLQRHLSPPKSLGFLSRFDGIRCGQSRTVRLHRPGRSHASSSQPSAMKLLCSWSFPALRDMLDLAAAAPLRPDTAPQRRPRNWEWKGVGRCRSMVVWPCAVPGAGIAGCKHSVTSTLMSDDSAIKKSWLHWSDGLIHFPKRMLIGFVYLINLLPDQ
ncbi:uncharacterized protein LOC124674723 [Lolium rigidum]|nr:uncharacterized protein LOC124674723 [Lolium rigidum]